VGSSCWERSRGLSNSARGRIKRRRGRGAKTYVKVRGLASILTPRKEGHQKWGRAKDFKGNPNGARTSNLFQVGRNVNRGGGGTGAGVLQRLFLIPSQIRQKAGGKMRRRQSSFKSVLRDHSAILRGGEKVLTSQDGVWRTQAPPRGLLSGDRGNGRRKEGGGNDHLNRFVRKTHQSNGGGVQSVLYTDPGKGISGRKGTQKSEVSG